MTSPAEKDCSLSGSLCVTRILPVSSTAFGSIHFEQAANDFVSGWSFALNDQIADAEYLRQAARELQTSDVPVAFPTETVYGLGADATRSSAVNGIFRAKNRPSDNPLIVHVASLEQLRGLLRPITSFNRLQGNDFVQNNHLNGVGSDRGNFYEDDPIPKIYRPLISKFWPGPLTLIMPNHRNSVLAPEVTAGLSTFGVRMPKSPLALVLIKLANMPLAAPSANASTRPSPTTAEHVKSDLDGRIKLIIDGGPCIVGVESTVVDGLSDPPLILRPGGVSIEQIRECYGWQNVKIGYKNAAESGEAPKAPGMKYKHYSPKAKVILYESNMPLPTKMPEYCGVNKRLGIIRTKMWPGLEPPVFNGLNATSSPDANYPILKNVSTTSDSLVASSLDNLHVSEVDIYWDSTTTIKVFDVNLGADTENIARGLFSALRALDTRLVDTILVEGIDENSGDTAAAIMNRLRKASETTIRSE